MVTCRLKLIDFYIIVSDLDLKMLVNLGIKFDIIFYLNNNKNMCGMLMLSKI